MRLMTLDLSSLSGFFCEFSGFNFYDGLLTTTLVTFSIVVCIGVRVIILTRMMKLPSSSSEWMEWAEEHVRTLKKALFYTGALQLTRA